MLALVLVATFIASAVGQFQFPALHKIEACGLSSAINSNWKQLGALSNDDTSFFTIDPEGPYWLAQFSVCVDTPTSEKVLLMAEGNKLQEWKLTFLDYTRNIVDCKVVTYSLNCKFFFTFTIFISI